MAEPESLENPKAEATAHNGAGQQEPQNEANKASGEDPNQDVNLVKKVNLCGVCEKNASKYKCPRCYLP